MTYPAFPDAQFAVVRDSVVGRSDDPTEPDVILGCVVVAHTTIRDRTARAQVQIDRPLELELRNDEAIINIARPGLIRAFQDLITST